ncbi:MAG TPA: hypothetical protein VFN22_05755 [Gemmatimonadales bacterium]|nr:hypothetical protein [Gemmatimonadales bacterium]
MSRLLTTVRVTVPASCRAAYLETITALAARHEARGNHLWLFELHGTPGTFLECSEGRGGGHRADGPGDEIEARLEERLAELGHYEDNAARWGEVPLVHHPKE